MGTDLPLPDFSISPAVTGDEIQFRQIALGTDVDAWSVDDYLDEIERGESLVFKAVKGKNEIVGFVLARMIPGVVEGSDAELYNVAVWPENQCNGIGTRLVTALLTILQKEKVNTVWLEVRESNEKARNFYAKHGWSAVSVRKRFYTNPVENAVIMRLDLTLATDAEEIGNA